jgi:hypothetical protein
MISMTIKLKLFKIKEETENAVQLKKYKLID